MNWLVQSKGIILQKRDTAKFSKCESKGSNTTPPIFSISLKKISIFQNTANTLSAWEMERSWEVCVLPTFLLSLVLNSTKDFKKNTPINIKKFLDLWQLEIGRYQHLSLPTQRFITSKEDKWKVLLRFAKPHGFVFLKNSEWKLFDQAFL